jgi:hypothetical protein
MGTRNLFVGKERPAHKADNLTAICEPIVGTSTSHNPMGLHGLLQGQLYRKMSCMGQSGKVYLAFISDKGESSEFTIDIWATVMLGTATHTAIV